MIKYQQRNSIKRRMIYEKTVPINHQFFTCGYYDP